ncbi:MAG: hypothetical protein CR975_06465 [Gammaproteobacteria bacterium]|nr:MAG: hypothetical protein CR975_06465 [Gammaproteobacteria bacterium]
MNIEWIGYSAAVCTTLSFIPQVIHIFRRRDTQAISLGMYSFFTFGITLWLVYGILLNNYPMMIANVITLLLSLSILAYKIHDTFFVNSR